MKAYNMIFFSLVTFLSLPKMTHASAHDELEVAQQTIFTDVTNKNREKVQRYPTLKGNPNAIDQAGRTLLERAIAAKYPPIVRALLDEKADATKTQGPLSPKEQAQERRHYVIEALINESMTNADGNEIAASKKPSDIRDMSTDHSDNYCA